MNDLTYPNTPDTSILSFTKGRLGKNTQQQEFTMLDEPSKFKTWDKNVKAAKEILDGRN